MKIVNSGQEDYHIHSLNFSDGVATINEIVQAAGIFGLTKIAITDHSQASINKHDWPSKKYSRSIIKRWANIYNDVEVIFGVEGDIINDEGFICDHIDGAKGDFLVLSAHDDVYNGDQKKINQAYRNAIENNADKIGVIGHPSIYYFEKHLDINALIDVANHYQVPLEFNCANLVNGKTNLNNLHQVLTRADQVYVNSDSHTLKELRDVRKIGFQYLKDQGFLNDIKEKV